MQIAQDPILPKQQKQDLHHTFLQVGLHILEIITFKKRTHFDKNVDRWGQPGNKEPNSKEFAQNTVLGNTKPFSITNEK